MPVEIVEQPPDDGHIPPSLAMPEGEVMPAIKSYIVSQSREVKVRANTLEDAVRIASAAFRGETDKPEGVWGDVTSDIEATDISARESY